MDNRPMGREKRIVSGGTGIRRTGEGLGKEISERGIRKVVEAAEKVEELEQKSEFVKKLFPKQ